MGKNEVPALSVATILNMEDQDAAEVKNKLDDLHNAWVKNQKAIKAKDFRIADVKNELKDRTLTLNEVTKEMNQFMELR